MTKLHLSIALGLYKEGFLSSVQRGDFTGPDKEYVPTTTQNISTRRLWLGLKYQETRPVLKKMQMVSKPSRKIITTPQELHSLVLGRSVRGVPALELGEVMFIRAYQTGEVLEIQDAVKRHVGGEILCRAS
jgi:small subunit ribosomal protein S8